MPIDKIRHSLSHLLAIAILEKFPKAKLGIGPVIDNGFYYDFLLPDKISSEDLPAIEKRVHELIKQNLPFKVEKVTASEAKKQFKNQPFKLELIDELKKKKSPITLYHTGDIFTDLCAGPHVKNTKEIALAAFSINKLAGAYWKGNEKNTMLTRIYGLAFNTKKELVEYKNQLAEAEKRDHRKIGAELNLFTFSPLVGSGLPLFTPKGTILRNELSKFIEELQTPLGYTPVSIPHITKRELYRTSGHWDKFKEDLFHVKGKNGSYVIKPMNCPHHTQIYASVQRSYKDLPLRFFEITAVYRDEQPGELQGLSRVLSITQDDGHAFCRPDQIAEEISSLFTVIKKVYQVFNMPLSVRLSTHDPKNFKDKYLGDKKVWDKAINLLKSSLKTQKLDFFIGIGEASFYGPKIDFIATDAIGRSWQVATIQVDFNMPAKFGLEYIDDKGKKQTPVMIHRAILGSLERFLAIMIEHYAGAFPVWLAPVQIRVLPISEKHTAYATQIGKQLNSHQIRYELDNSSDTIGKKIRNSELQKIPYTIIVGDKEKKSKTISLRKYGAGDLGSSSLDKFLTSVCAKIKQRQ